MNAPRPRRRLGMQPSAIQCPDWRGRGLWQCPGKPPSPFSLPLLHSPRPLTWSHSSQPLSLSLCRKRGIREMIRTEGWHWSPKLIRLRFTKSKTDTVVLYQCCINCFSELILNFSYMHQVCHMYLCGPILWPEVDLQSVQHGTHFILRSLSSYIYTHTPQKTAPIKNSIIKQNSM